MIPYIKIYQKMGKVLYYSAIPYDGMKESLIISDDDIYIGEEGALPGASFPQAREATFQILNESIQTMLSIVHVTAEYHIIFNGKDYLITSGILNDVSIDNAGTISARISFISTTKYFEPSSEKVVSEKTFPRTGRTFTGLISSIGTSAIGKFYPTVIGRPGAICESPNKEYTWNNAVPGSPAYLVETTSNNWSEDQTFLIAGHKVVSSEVVIFQKGQSEKADAADKVRADLDMTLPIEYDVDNEGAIFAYVTLPPLLLSFDTYFSTSDNFFVKWINTSGVAEEGGMKSPYGEGVLTKAGEVIRWAVDKSGIKWDNEKTSNLQAFNNIKIDTYLNEPVNTWEWALQTIIPYIPAISVVSGNGVYLAPFQRSFLDRSICQMTMPVLAELSSPITTSSAENLATEITVQYAPSDMASSGYIKSHTIKKDEMAIFGKNWQVLGDRPVLIELPIIYDSSSAQAILSWQAEYLGTTWAFARYSFKREKGLPQVGNLIWNSDIEKAQLIYSWKLDSRDFITIDVIWPLF